MARGRAHELRYLVEIPIPYMDRRGRALDRRKRLRWQRRLEMVLTECLGEDLDQADVFILAYDSDSLLIEVAERTH